MKTLLLVTSICVALIIGCDKKDDGKGKEISGHQNDELIQEVNKVNSDLERIRTRDIHAGDPQSLDKINASLQESRKKIRDLESRVDSARRGDMAGHKSGHTLRSNGERMTTSEQMSDGLFKKKLQDLVKGLEAADSPKQLSAAKSVRELQASYPDRDYSMVIIPLMRIVKNEDANGPLRIAAARALHGVDSERGDFAIKGVASESNNKSVRKVCTLLSAERERQDERIEQELEELDREAALVQR